jgi:hypothetical protein
MDKSAGGSRRRAVLDVVVPVPRGSQSEATVRRLCREALALGSALEMDCWISSVLGQFWEQRLQAPPLELERAFVLGAPVAEQLARSRVRGARLVLQAIAFVDRGALGARCAQLADGLRGEALPAWARRRRPVRVSRAVSVGVPGDGAVLFLGARGGGRRPHTLAVYVDERQGGVAKHIHVLESLGVWADEVLGPHGALGAPGVELTPADAAERVVEAIRRADENPDAQVDESAIALRALALARADTGRVSDRSAWLN